ncbi:MAG: protein-disulfide reductase DsbD, partial [Planctomycetota bacterium]
MRFRTYVHFCLHLALVCGLLAVALPGRAATTFLEPERAFRFAARVLDERNVEVSFEVAPGYYLYREQLKFEAAGATLGVPDIPRGKVKFDETFQKNVETFRDTLRIVVPVERAGSGFRLLVTSQGCADEGLCYPPMRSAADVRLAAFGGDGSLRLLASADIAAADSNPAPVADSAASASAPSSVLTKALGSSSAEAAPIDAALRGGRFWPVVGVFLVAGVLLSLTPCVLPMLPILSSIIVGHGAQVSRRRGLGLAASYSLGMALVYTLFGIAAGLAGEGLAAALQNPWVLGAFAAVLVGLALSMFGAFEIQLPAALAGGLGRASQRIGGGRIAGVFAMGGLSALIVSPCVAAPLAGALVYLSQTRDVALGGAALFSLAAGMSVPLLLLGVSAGTLLPKAGAWMD